MNLSTRIDPNSVIASIASTTYTLLPSGKAIVCEITLHSGWICHGTSAVVDLDNYDEARGKDAAKAKALQQVWDYAAARMQEAMFVYGTVGGVTNRNAELMAEHKVKSNGQPLLLTSI